MSDLAIIQDPFAGIKGIIPATEVVPEKRLKIAIIGKQKAGKSWCAATAPEPVFYAEFDGRKESLKGKPGIFIKEFADKAQSMPNAISDLESDLATYKYAKSQVRAIPASYVFDSMTYMRKCLENEIMKQMGATVYRTLKVTTSQVLRIPASYDVVNAVRGYMEYFIAEFAQLGNVICVFHEKDEKDVDRSTKTETAYTHKVTIDPQYLATILSTFNEVYRITVDGSGKYTVTTGPSDEFTGSTTLLLDKEEPPNIKDMVRKHQSRVGIQK